MKNMPRLLELCALAALITTATAFPKEHGPATSSRFQGPKANTGTAIHSHENGRSVLRVSSDFKVPDTPAPTWRIVDARGTIYTLDAFKIKGGEKRSVNVPSYVPNIAKVQVYCAWAELLLGEASFSPPAE